MINSKWNATEIRKLIKPKQVNSIEDKFNYLIERCKDAALAGNSCYISSGVGQNDLDLLAPIFRQHGFVVIGGEQMGDKNVSMEIYW